MKKWNEEFQELEEVDDDDLYKFTALSALVKDFCSVAEGTVSARVPLRLVLCHAFSHSHTPTPNWTQSHDLKSSPPSASISNLRCL